MTTITIEHIVTTSDKPFEKVISALEARLGMAEGVDKLLLQLEAERASWEQITQAIEKVVGKSGLAIFGKIEHGLLLSVAGKSNKAIQYTIGNPLLAVRMTKHLLPVALYAPFKLLVYEDNAMRTVIVYDRFSSILSQFHNTEVSRVAEIVDKKLEALLVEVL